MSCWKQEVKERTPRYFAPKWLSCERQNQDKERPVEFERPVDRLMRTTNEKAAAISDTDDFTGPGALWVHRVTF